MATPNFIAAAEGFDIYTDGVIAQDWPWFTGTAANTGQITSGTGTFTGKSLTMNRGATALTLGQTYQFPNGGTFQRNNTATNGKSLYGINFWIRIDAVQATLAGSNLLYLTSSANTAQVLPLLGILNNTTNGLNLLFPSTVASIATTPYMMAIQTGVWYWISIRFAVYPNAQLRATYVVNGIPIQENVALAFATDPISTNVCNRLAFMGGTTNVTYSMDDLVIQAVNGSMSTWPSGFTTGTPNDPAINDLPLLSPRRIYAIPANANGSVTEWTPTNGLPNWQAATQAGESVEALDAELTDLYKFDVPPTATLTDVVGVVARASTNKYLSVTPTMKQTAASAQVDSPGVVTKNTSRFISVQEQTPDNQAWTTALIEGAEFGQKSL